MSSPKLRGRGGPGRNQGRRRTNFRGLAINGLPTSDKCSVSAADVTIWKCHYCGATWWEGFVEHVWPIDMPEDDPDVLGSVVHGGIAPHHGRDCPARENKPMKAKSLYLVTDQESEQVYRGDPARLPFKVVAQHHLSQAELDMLREDGEAAYEKAASDVKAAWRALRAGQDADLAWDEDTEGGYAVMEWREE